MTNDQKKRTAALTGATAALLKNKLPAHCDGVESLQETRGPDGAAHRHVSNRANAKNGPPDGIEAGKFDSVGRPSFGQPVFSIWSPTRGVPRDARPS
jgi:hypothetical protein